MKVSRCHPGSAGVARGCPAIKASIRCADERRQLVLGCFVCCHCSEAWSFSIVRWRSRIGVVGIHLNSRGITWQRSNLSSKLLITRREISHESLREHGSRHTLSDDCRIIPKRGKDLAQRVRLPGIASNTIHLCLKLLRRNRPLPVKLQRSRVTQVIADLSFDLCLRHHLLQRRLGALVYLRPNAMTPVNFLNSSLIRHTIFKCERLTLCRWLHHAAEIVRPARHIQRGCETHKHG